VHVARREASSEHFLAVADHDRYALAELLLEAGVGVDVDHCEGVASATRPGLHPREGLVAEHARRTGQEVEVGHQRDGPSLIVGAIRADAGLATVATMRPGTVITVLLLLMLLVVAGVVFVIRLQSI
jgi:hypothetical protein